VTHPIGLLEITYSTVARVLPLSNTMSAVV